MSVRVPALVMMVMMSMTVGTFVNVLNFIDPVRIAATTISAHFRKPPATPALTHAPAGRMN